MHTVAQLRHIDSALTAETLRDVAIVHAIGTESRIVAASLGIADRLPALVMTDSCYAVTGILPSPPAASRAREFFVQPSSFAVFAEPAEGAYYTASALIDGLPFREVHSTNPELQAAYFGETFMLWTTGKKQFFELRLDPRREWVHVNCVGKVTPLPLGPEGLVAIAATQSPVYILARDTHHRLTR